jgi:non-specific serine/threonine protein kinase
MKDCIPTPILELDERDGCTYGTLWFSYDGREFTYRNDCRYISVGVENGCYTVYQRRRKMEKDLFEYLRVKFAPLHDSDFHPYRYDFHSHTYGSFSETLNFPMSSPQFLVQHGKEILDEGIEIRLRGKKLRVAHGRGALAMQVHSSLDWFDVKVGYRDEKGGMHDINFDEDLLSSGLLRAGDQYVIIDEKEIRNLENLLEEGMSANGALKVPSLRFHFIDEFYQTIVNRDDPAIERIKRIHDRLKDFTKIDSYEFPRGFQGALREYQSSGYRWLNFLHDYDLNGCLADDMGLGKTVQTLALLQRLAEKHELALSLIVVPVNTLANWEREIDRFAPSLRYRLHYGIGRNTQFEDGEVYDFILTTYHTLRNDIQHFKEMVFRYVILDESQSIKNSNSLLFKSVRLLKSEHRLSLTGTPIENSTLELWSLMEFLNPGLLGSRKDFVRKFAKPIEGYGDEKTVQKLKKITYPFILRRRKEDVLKELPDKSEILLYSQMEKRQSEVYEEHRNFCREAVAGAIEREGLDRAAVVIFSALLKLRQIALFPVLADEKFKRVQSCKFIQLQDVVGEILQENHKIVIFSQFVKCLAIIRSYVEERNLRYAYIDGTLNAARRKEEIHKFQNQDEYKLFLLSLKAGGVGINLTAADYVILFDPWWNPAVENQAVDRLHRIGQTRKVIAYKMIVENTVEEKMLELQERKKKLVSELITTEKGYFKSLSKEDVIGLFE